MNSIEKLLAANAHAVADANAAGVKNIWMQPGAEEPQASQSAREAGINVIDVGACVPVCQARE